MRSKVADALREDTRARDARLTPDERIERALELGDADVAALRTARGLSQREARAAFFHARQTGRRPSRANDR